MGYSTDYDLEIIEGRHEFKKRCCNCNKESSTNYCGECGSTVISGCHEIQIGEIYCDNDSPFTGDEVRWYTWQRDMIDYSKRHPNLVFQLDGKGEESGDVWRAYFKNGKVKVHKIKMEFDKYDEKELEELK